jgi:hypothetical protein
LPGLRAFFILLAFPAVHYAVHFVNVFPLKIVFQVFIVELELNNYIVKYYFNMRLYFILFILIIGCKKAKESYQVTLVNSFQDSLYISVKNNTNPNLSVPGIGIGKYGLIKFSANEADDLNIHGKLKPNKKWGRHPLFIDEFNYDSSLIMSYKTQLINFDIPASKLIYIAVQNHYKDVAVKGTLIYNNVEDSLFSIPPGELIEGLEPVGYFLTSQVQNIDRPFIKQYVGNNPPYIVKSSSTPLWGTGAINPFGLEQPKPSTNAGPNASLGYLYSIQ